MKGCAKGMKVVSDKYENGEYYVPEVLVSARAMKRAVDVLQPHIKVEGAEMPGKIMLGVVDGDVHDIGKNLVKILLSAAGFDVVDLGKDVHAEDFIDAIKEEKPQIVGLSTLMSPTMLTMENTLKEFEKEGIRDEIKVIVGGAIVNREFADEIGADGYEKDAAKTVKLVEKLLKI